ncbi:hypothetical protein [Streptomyces synnematoformans]|uniref:hypothetical protein n=1 Tax=Streptomyces synnematoformans TaxID=415721 RepID=UPI0031D780F9
MGEGGVDDAFVQAGFGALAAELVGEVAAGFGEQVPAAEAVAVDVDDDGGDVGGARARSTTGRAAARIAAAARRATASSRSTCSAPKRAMAAVRHVARSTGSGTAG